MRRAHTPLLTLTFVLATGAAAFAQPDTGTVFIGAGAFAAIETSPSYDAFLASFPAGAGDEDDTVAGGTLALGVHLTPRVSARVEWSLTADRRSGFDDSVFLPAAGTPGGGLGGFPTSLPIFRTRFDSRRHDHVGAALLGYHFKAGRASIELLGGLGVIRQTVETAIDYRLANPGSPTPFPGGILPIPPTSRSKQSSYSSAAVVGADAAVSLTTHAAVVPTLRLFTLNGGLHIRPGLGLRWTF